MKLRKDVKIGRARDIANCMRHCAPQDLYGTNHFCTIYQAIAFFKFVATNRQKYHIISALCASPLRTKVSRTPAFAHLLVCAVQHVRTNSSHVSPTPYYRDQSRVNCRIQASSASCCAAHFCRGHLTSSGMPLQQCSSRRAWCPHNDCVTHQPARMANFSQTTEVGERGGC